MAEAEDLKSSKCGFDPHPGHFLQILQILQILHFLETFMGYSPRDSE